jgi:predicted AAA+ superfamily ATPase
MNSHLADARTPRWPRHLALADPIGSVAELTGVAIIDVQRAPDLLLAINERLDRDDRAGQSLITGSANIRTLPTIRDALPGRVERCSTTETPDGREVDVVLERADGSIVGLEVKSAATVVSADFRSLAYLRDKLGSRFVRGVVLYAGTRALPFGERLSALPLSCLWS